MFNLNETVVKKVLDAVRPGLSNGLGVQESGEMCVEAAVCFALGLPHSDDPKCVNQALRTFKIVLNDSFWSSNQARAKGLERLAIAQLGTLDTLDTKAFIDGLVVLAKKWASQAQETAGISNARAVYAAADDAVNYAIRTADAAIRTADYAIRTADAAIRTADAAIRTADAVAYATAYAADYAARAARAAARAAAYVAARVDANAARDKVLAQCAEDVVQLLIKLEAPGTKYLYLTEKV